MDILDLGLLLGIGAVAALHILVVDQWLRHRGGRIRTRIVASAAAATFIASVIAMRVSVDSGALALASAAGWAAVAFAPEYLVSLTGGPRPIVALREAVFAIETLAVEWGRTRDSTLAREMATRLSALDRLRSAKTSEYIDLFQEEIEHLLAGATWPEGYTKMDRMHQLEHEFHVWSVAHGVRGNNRRWE